VSDRYNLQRFVDAQQDVFEAALAELQAGRKQSHWMWFIFPQLAALGQSPTARYFGIRDADEAAAYLAHPLLGARLARSVETLLPWGRNRSAQEILGRVDGMKLRSSLTLFDFIRSHGLFGEALTVFFDGPDERTLALLCKAKD
jgi:uncharacterized protein (DUF1810 family)